MPGRLARGSYLAGGAETRPGSLLGSVTFCQLPMMPIVYGKRSWLFLEVRSKGGR